MRLQSAIFDMDGTLLDSMHIWNGIWAQLVKNHGFELSPEVNEKLMTYTPLAGAQYCKETFGLSQTPEELIAETSDMVKHFYTHDVQPKPGVVKFLSLLKMEGVWMYVATNTDRQLVEAALEHTGLRSYFRGVITSSEVGKGKRESPEIYERAMQRLQSNKLNTVIFEDAVHAIRTAKDAGFRVCGVYDEVSKADQEEIQKLSDYYIRSFDEMFTTNVLD